MKTSQETATPKGDLVDYNDGWGSIKMSPEAAKAQEAINARNGQTAERVQAILNNPDASDKEKDTMIANARKEAESALQSEAPLPGGLFGTDSPEAWREAADARRISIAESLPSVAPNSELEQIAPQQQPSRVKKFFNRLIRRK